MKGLKKYLLDRENAIDHLLEKPSRSFTPSTFHKLRVEIKKLIAFFELVEFCAKDFRRNKAIKPFRPIFRQAGKVREIQVEEALLNKYFTNTVLTGYRKSLRIRKSKERTDFFALINESATARLKKSFHDTIPMLPDIDNKKVNGYLKEKRERIKKRLIQCDFKPDQIHDLRKLIKSYYYNTRIFGSGNQNATPAKQVDLSDLLGKWHDSQVIINHLDQAIAYGGMSPEDSVQIAGIKAVISSQNELLLVRIKTAMSASEFTDLF